jgi:predicted phosphoribosyltransferase
VTYRNRQHAGERLAKALLQTPETSRLKAPVVLGIVRGGVPVAAEVARAVGGTLGPAFATKIGAPGNPELAVGALADSTPLVDPISVARLGITDDQLEIEIRRRLDMLEEKRSRFAGYMIDVGGQDVIVVDDGVATGHTMAAVLDSMRRAGARSVWLAVPVGPPDTVVRLAPKVDVVVCPLQPARFIAVGAWYEQFPQLSDEDVAAVLEEATHQ